MDNQISLPAYQYALFDKDNQQHKYILSLTIQIGWTKIWNKRTVADLARLGHWIKSEKSSWRKPLKSMTTEEVQTIIYQLEEILKSV